MFLAYALAVGIVFNLNRSVAWRQLVLFAASIGFLAFFSLRPTAFIPLAAFLAFGFISLRAMQAGRTKAFVPVLVAGIAAFMWLKKYTFIPSDFLLHYPYVTLGLSYIFFRVLSLIIDARNGELAERITLGSYLNYTLNFTTLVCGPIQKYQDFAAMQLAPTPLPLNIIVAGQAFERIVVGFFKVNVLSLALSMVHGSELTVLGATHSGNERILAGILTATSYTLYLYCNFSGYIDIVIGIARFLRIVLPENFDRPFSSGNFVVFWSRWHMTLSAWWRAYVYNPLVVAGMRRWPSPGVEPFLAVFAFFVTFFLVGVWHGQTSMFLFFGLLIGLGVSVAKLYQVLMGRWLGRKPYKELSRRWLYSTAARGLTFTWFTFTALWFWSSWAQLDFLMHALGPLGCVLVWTAMFVVSSVVLAAWEVIREWLLSLHFGSQPLLQSRYVRTVWGTALVVIAATTLILNNAPVPDIVYKTF
jgi:alginate O-acetyltransferase complex protein AlgI